MRHVVWRAGARSCFGSVAGLLVLALFVMVGCESGGSGGADATGEEPDPNGTLRFATAQPIFTWDPHRQGNATGPFQQYYMVYDPLVQLENDLTLSPRAATSWETAPDGMSAEFELRTDVTFDDGTPLDAAAVKANFDRAMTLEGSTVASAIAAMNVESVEVVNPSTVRFSFATATYTFPFALSSEARANFMVNPSAFADAERLAQAPAGSGPYTVGSQTSNTSATFERRDDYWDDVDTRPATQIWNYVADDQARLNALQSGQADIVYLLPGTNTTDAEALAERDPSTFQFHRYALVKQNALFLNTASGPFTDPAMRKAVDLAVDREAVSEAFSDGAEVPSRQIFSPVREGYLEELDDPDLLRADPEAAEEVLAEAGITNPRIVADVPNATAYLNAAQVVQQNLAEAGIEMEITPVQGSQTFPEFATGNYDMMVSLQAIAADSTAVVQSDLVATALALDGLLPYLEPSVTEILSMEPGDERTRALEALNELLIEDPMHIYMGNAATATIATSQVGGLEDMLGSALFQGPVTRDLTISHGS